MDFTFVLVAASFMVSVALADWLLQKRKK